jgi:hypothetical protein
MDCKTVKRLRRKFEKLRGEAQGGMRAVKLEGFADSLGLVRRRKNTWKSTRFPHNRPITIHPHPKPIKPPTAMGILDSFETELFQLEEKYCREKESGFQEKRS